MAQATEAELSPSSPRRRYAWLAAVMSLFWPGVGQLYNGEARKALAFFAIWVLLTCAFVVFTVAATPGPATIIVMYALAALVVCVPLYGAIDGFRRARRLGTVVLKRYQRVWIYALATVVSLLVTNVVARLGAWRPFSISSVSMVPTVEPGDYIMTKWYARDEAPQRGDLAIFHLARDRRSDYFKRVIGLPGDRIQLRAGVVYVNGVPLARERVADTFLSDWVGTPLVQYAETLPDGRSYRIAKIAKGDLGAYNNTAEVLVPADRYFVLGDNRDNSSDSRDPIVGLVARDDIVARGYVIYWSAKHDRIAHALD